MNGLFLGVMGGSATAGGLVVGGFLSFFKNIFIKEKIVANKIELIIGIILFVSAASFFDYKVRLLMLIVYSFFGFASILISNKLFADSLNPNISINNPDDSRSYTFLLLLLIKSLWFGLSAGAVMLIANDGLGNSLLFAISLNCILSGIIAGATLADLGLDSVIGTLAIFLIAIMSLVAGVFGGYLIESAPNLLAITLAATSGVMMSESIIKVSISMKNIEMKKIVNSSVASITIIALAFIAYKEFV